MSVKARLRFDRQESDWGTKRGVRIGEISTWSSLHLRVLWRRPLQHQRRIRTTRLATAWAAEKRVFIGVSAFVDANIYVCTSYLHVRTCMQGYAIAGGVYDHAWACYGSKGERMVVISHVEVQWTAMSTSHIPARVRSVCITSVRVVEL